MEIPTKPREPLGKNPTISIIYSAPKTGKTTICSHLNNHLILELEPNGAKYLKANVLDINRASEFLEAIDSIAKGSHVFDYLIVDSVSKLDEWSEIVGTYNYMSTSQGKKFNIVDGKMITHLEKNFETVHDMANGYGYKWSRAQMIEWYDKLVNLTVIGKVKHVILLAHLKDKMVESKSGDTVESIEIALTGKVKTSYASRVDAIAFMSRKNGRATLAFDNEHKTATGGRCSHLDGVIEISNKLPDGTIECYWDRIFLKE